MIRLGQCVALLSGLIMCGIALGAGSTEMINYQGTLDDDMGDPIDGVVSVTFSIYDVDTGGTPLWTETQSVTLSEGIFNVHLGDISPIPEDLFNDADRYLGTKVGADAEMTPRVQMASVGYAFSSRRIAGDRIESGQEGVTITDTSSGSANVSFTSSFSSPPKVLVGPLSDQIGGVTFVVEQVTSITTTGCTVVFSSLDGGNASGTANFDWIAIGK